MEFRKIRKEKNFYKSKFMYYKNFNMWVVIAACVSSVFYYLSDIYLFGYFSVATLPCRLAILIPLVIFLVVNKFSNNYRLLIALSYICGHCIMLCTIWTCFKLTDLSFACEGFLIINLVFLALAIAAPFEVGIVGHGLLFVDISIANIFLHYPEFNMMLILGLPCYFGICVFDIAIERTYADQYVSRQKIESDLIHDPLTRAYNRKFFDTITDTSKQFISFPGTKISVLMFDIDHFKQINDNFGHEAGDKVLEYLAVLVNGSIRSNDYLIRWGGEEFVLILNDCSLKDAEAKAERLRQKLVDSQYNEYDITISVGVAQYSGGDYNECIQHADEAMYTAKNGGRNQVRVFVEDPLKVC